MHTLLYYFGIIIFRPSQFTAFFNARDSPLTLSTPAIVVSFLLYGLIIIIAGFAAAAAKSFSWHFRESGCHGQSRGNVQNV
jgi:hypothetical protein